MTAVWRAARGLPVPEATRLLSVQTAGRWWLSVRIQALAVSAGTNVTVTGLKRMPVDIAVRSVRSLG
jgi:hypothetical protein